MQSTPREKPSSDGLALVTDEYFWRRINESSPFGMKCLLINEQAGSWFPGILSRNDKFSTHYAPAPKFHPDDKLNSSVTSKRENKLIEPLNDFVLTKEIGKDEFAVLCYNGTVAAREYYLKTFCKMFSFQMAKLGGKDESGNFILKFKRSEVTTPENIFRALTLLKGFRIGSKVPLLELGKGRVEYPVYCFT